MPYRVLLNNTRGISIFLVFDFKQYLTPLPGGYSRRLIMDNSKLPAYPVSLTREWREDNNGGMYEIKDDYEGLSKLEAFTMAAMQGLCVVFGKEIATGNYAQFLAKDAIDIAKATLSELSKH